MLDSQREINNTVHLFKGSISQMAQCDSDKGLYKVKRQAKVLGSNFDDIVSSSINDHTSNL